jgi:CheY-like chemotaxis protein
MTDSDNEGGGPAKVLVVDDEHPVAKLYKTYLEDDFEVLTANEGREALTMVDESVDVVLLDRRMPGMSGDEVLGHIRDRSYDCRVVMVTALDPDFEIADMPFDGYVTKPIGEEEMIEVVEQQLQYATYDDKLTEYFRVRSKLEVLEEEKAPETLEADERYAKLRRHARSLRNEIDTIFDDEDIDPNMSRVMSKIE